MPVSKIGYFILFETIWKKTIRVFFRQNNLLQVTLDYLLECLNNKYICFNINAKVSLYFL